jgi:hypothetical protein
MAARLLMIKTFMRICRRTVPCKLEVFDTNGEARFEQRALYEGEHYELGILFVQDERNDGAKIGEV